MSWRDRPLGGLDLETTGVDPTEARVVTACVVRTNTPDRWQRDWLINPGVEIPDAAAAVHGITTEHARDHGQEPAVALAEIRQAIRELWADGAPLIGHNIVYDLTVLDHDLRRHGLPGLTIDGPVIDTLVVDKAIDKFRRGSRQLQAVAEHYQVRLDGAHTASGDVMAACRVAWVLAGRATRSGQRLGDLPLDDLHALQVDWYAEQRRSFADYKAKRGEPVDDVSTDWPIRQAAA